jgi:hypothetical protein
MSLQIDPNFESRRRMMAKARLDTQVNSEVEVADELLAEIAGKISDDLIRQHTLVSPEQAAELQAHFNLGKED